MTGQPKKLAITPELASIANVGGVVLTSAERDWDGYADGKKHLAAIAQAEYSGRRQRDALFCKSLFAEPAWDMLLDLYVQRHFLRPVSINSLCVAAAVPQTTALRWIRRLEVNSLIVRCPSPHDNRVVHVELSDEGMELMERYLRARLGVSEAVHNHSHLPG